MRKFSPVLWMCAALCTPFLFVTKLQAHGFVGDRFFPATITTEDPFAVDELSLTGTYFKQPGEDGEPQTREIDGGFEFAKEILPGFAVGVEDTYIHLKPDGEHGFEGWDNVGVSLKYEVWHSDEHEAIVSIGLDSDIGGTGSSKIGESFSTFTPAIFFGKGFGDLPEGFGALLAFAVTGTVGQTFPTSAEESNALEWGFAVEYNIPYLQQHIRDVGLPEPFKNMIPLVECSFETPENRGQNITTGTINPGILWETKAFQLGVEALIPINHESGSQVGFTVQLQIYIDDLFPKVFGHPVFGAR
jgi:hypothetical protein